MKKVLTLMLFSVLFLLTTQASAASMSCDVSLNGPGGGAYQSAGFCEGLDFSFARSTTVTFDIDPGSASVIDVIWIQGCTAPNGSMSCTTNLAGYFPKTARAILILPPDEVSGNFLEVSATAYYESGY